MQARVWQAVDTLTRETYVPAYFIGNYEITDIDAYKKYQRGAKPIFAGGGKLLVLDGESGVLEGDGQPSTVVIEYPSREAAEAAYSSEEYQAVAGIRIDATANRRVLLVDGFVPPNQ